MELEVREGGREGGKEKSRKISFNLSRRVTVSVVFLITHVSTGDHQQLLPENLIAPRPRPSPPLIPHVS
jgi:hypothetical protein